MEIMTSAASTDSVPRVWLRAAWALNVVLIVVLLQRYVALQLQLVQLSTRGVSEHPSTAADGLRVTAARRVVP